MKLNRTRILLVFVATAVLGIIVSLVSYTFALPIKGFIAVHNGIDKEVVVSEGVELNDLFTERLHLIDENVIDSYLRHGYSVNILTANEFNEQWNGSKVKVTLQDGYVSAGYFSMYQRALSIDPKDYICVINLNSDYASRSIIHEFGHYVDSEVARLREGELDWVSNTPEFLEIFEEEKYNSGKEGYFLESPQEYFADSYFSLKTWDEYRQRCPKTCEYIERVVKEIK